jgi:hypothetical protein
MFNIFFLHVYLKGKQTNAFVSTYMLIHPWGALISESNQSANHPGFLNGRSDESIAFMKTI